VATLTRFEDMTVNSGANINLIDITLRTTDLPPHVTNLQLRDYEIVRLDRKGRRTIVASGTANDSRDHLRITHTVHNAAPSYSGIYRVTVRYTLYYQDGNRLNLTQPFDVHLVVN